MRLIMQYHTEVNFSHMHAGIPQESAHLSKQYVNNETAGVIALVRHIQAARTAAESTVSRFSENHYNSQHLLHLSAAVQWSHELRKFLTANVLSLGEDILGQQPESKARKISAAINTALKEIGKLLKLLCTADLIPPHQKQAANAAYSLVTEFASIAGGRNSWMSKEARVARRVAEVYLAHARYLETLVKQHAEMRKTWKQETLVGFEALTLNTVK